MSKDIKHIIDKSRIALKKRDLNSILWCLRRLPTLLRYKLFQNGLKYFSNHDQGNLLALQFYFFSPRNSSSFFYEHSQTPSNLSESVFFQNIIFQPPMDSCHQIKSLLSHSYQFAQKFDNNGILECFNNPYFSNIKNHLIDNQQKHSIPTRFINSFGAYTNLFCLHKYFDSYMNQNLKEDLLGYLQCSNSLNEKSLKLTIKPEILNNKKSNDFHITSLINFEFLYFLFRTENINQKIIDVLLPKNNKTIFMNTLFSSITQNKKNLLLLSEDSLNQFDYKHQSIILSQYYDELKENEFHSLTEKYFNKAFYGKLNATFYKEQEKNIITNENFYIDHPISKENIHKIYWKPAQVNSFCGNPYSYSDFYTVNLKKFSTPYDVKYDSKRKCLWVTDRENNCIKQITIDGKITKVFGNGLPFLKNGYAHNCSIYKPTLLSISQEGEIYIAEPYNRSIRKILPEKNVMLSASGTGLTQPEQSTLSHTKQWNLAFSSFINPRVIHFSESNDLYVVDLVESLWKALTLYHYKNGNLVNKFSFFPKDLNNINLPGKILNMTSVDDNSLVLLDQGYNGLLKFHKKENFLEVLFGSNKRGYIDGNSKIARLNSPLGIANDSKGNIFVCDEENHAIRVYTTDGKVYTVAGGNGRGHANGNHYEAKFNTPTGITILPNDDLIVCDGRNNCLRKISFD